MNLPPLDTRSLDILQKEQKKLKETYEECAKVLGPNISPSGAQALDRISDAIEAIGNEIATRGAS